MAALPVVLLRRRHALPFHFHPDLRFQARPTAPAPRPESPAPESPAPGARLIARWHRDGDGRLACAWRHQPDSRAVPRG